MTPREAVLLTRYAKACFPQQPIDEYTADAWFDILGDLALADCKAAIVAVARQKPFIAPSEILAEVRRVRADRVARAALPAPAPSTAENAASYRESLRASIETIASGRSLGLALKPGARADSIPPASAGRFLARFRALVHTKPTQEELAGRQAAEARAARKKTEGSTPA
jgi:hypothetical protein